MHNPFAKRAPNTAASSAPTTSFSIRKRVEAAKEACVAAEASLDRTLTGLLASTGSQIGAVCLLYLVIAGNSGAFNTIGGLNLFATDPVFVLTMAQFAVAMATGLVAGAVVNVAGPRVSVVIAAISYTFYLYSQLSLLRGNAGDAILILESSVVRFAIFSATFATAGRGLLLSAAGSVVLAYPSEARKATVLTVAAAITGIAPITGFLVNTLLSWLAKTDSLDYDPPQFAYITCILIVVFLGGFGAMGLIKPYNKVHRNGHFIVRTNATLREEAIELKNLLRTRSVWLLASSIMLMSYFNGTTTSLKSASMTPDISNSARMMSLLNLIYNVVYIFGVATVSFTLLGNPNHTRSRRARMTSAVMAIGVMLVLVVTYLGSVTAYASYTVYAFYDGFAHTYFLWLMGALSNSAYKQARNVGFMYAAYFAVQEFRYWLWRILNDFVPTSVGVQQYDRIIMSVFVVLALVMMGVVNNQCVEETVNDGGADEGYEGEDAEVYATVTKGTDLEAAAAAAAVDGSSDEITHDSDLKKKKTVKFSNDSDTSSA
ncbi:hypothetical protein BC830DRAFT_1108487 [Chytriomyces sp. MP71]|nr:hypothetical protein BC830DRAFT_1108487 [Chytriomyces sp. MP71]